MAIGGEMTRLSMNPEEKGRAQESAEPPREGR